MENKYIKSRWVLVVLISLCILTAIILNFIKYNSFNDSFPPGVFIGGIKVAGTDIAGASRLLNHEFERRYNQPIYFYYSNDEEKIMLGSLCRPVDVDKLVRKVWNEEESEKWYERIYDSDGDNKNLYPVELEYIPEALTNLEHEWNQKWGSDFRDAAIEVDAAQGLIVKPGVAGMKVNAEKTFKTLPQEISSLPAQMRIGIVIEKAYPQVDEETLVNMGELAAYTTNFKTWEINRSHNLNTAASRLNKAVIAPQQIFSFNTHVGMRTTEQGYRDAMVIVGGKFEPGLGGGICQVSSTLYNTCLLAGMEIVERSNHNLAVSYVPLGQDATVVYGALDFKFKNNTGYPIYIRAVTNGGQLTVNIYGDLDFKKNIKITNSVEQVFDFKTTIVSDPTLAAGTEKIDHNGQPGYVVSSFRTYYDKSGQMIKTDKLARDRYLPLDKLILRGPSAPVTTTPEPEDPSMPPEETLPEDLPAVPESGIDVPPTQPLDLNNNNAPAPIR